MADKIFEEGRTGVAFSLAVLFENLVGEFGASFECKLFRKDKSVVTVEEDFLDLRRHCQDLVADRQVSGRVGRMRSSRSVRVSEYIGK